MNERVRPPAPREIAQAPGGRSKRARHGPRVSLPTRQV
jgi:hypothetical protein